uniref:Uncharacterized protein n=1 Tax=Plectus sambesii TaxID=2011161 RepID=A0A914VEB8_9BILA
MVLYGGVDYRQSSNNEIIRFSSMNDVISPMQVAGSIFLVSLSPGSVINLSFQTSSYYSLSYQSGGLGAKGLMMSTNFPNPNIYWISNENTFNGNGNNYYEYSINILRYDLGNTGRLTIKSTVPSSGFSKTLTSSGANTLMQFCANSFTADYNSWGSVEKGYVLRYDIGSLCSPPASPPSTSPPGPSDSGSHGLNSAWICIIIVATCVVIAVVASLISSSWKRSNPPPRPNNANATVPPVHFVSSQPNHGDAPPSYEEAMKYSTPNTSMYSNRCANVIILHA